MPIGWTGQGNASPRTGERMDGFRCVANGVDVRIRRLQPPVGFDSAGHADLESGGTGWREPVLGEATLAPNSVARVEIETQQPLAIDPCDTAREGGAFALLDADSDRAVADGVIRAEAEAATD